MTNTTNKLGLAAGLCAVAAMLLVPGIEARETPVLDTADVHIVDVDSDGLISQHVLIPGGCTLTFALAQAGDTIDYGWYAIFTAPGVTGQLSAALGYGGDTGSNGLAYVRCL